MQYLHIKNIEKYHPNYKDRQLVWCKAYFSMVNSDPEFLLLDEIDKWRFIAFVMIELQLQKPVPLDAKYLSMRGFDLKKRNISLTLKMLHTFIIVCYGNGNTNVENRSVEEYNKEEYTEEKSRGPLQTFDFECLWKRYPKPLGKKAAERHFIASVKTEKDYKDINTALDNYLRSDVITKDKGKFVQYGSTWFNNWRDYIDIQVTTGVSKGLLELQEMVNGSK